MEKQQLEQIINGMKKGTIHTLTYARPMKTRKGVTDFVTKVSTMQIRVGVRYDNIASVKQARQLGTLPSENAGLPATLEWIDNNFIVNKKTGAVLLRVASINGNKPRTSYRKNGQICRKEEVEPLCLKSEFTPRDAIPAVFNLSIDKILGIN